MGVVLVGWEFLLRVCSSAERPLHFLRVQLRVPEGLCSSLPCSQVLESSVPQLLCNVSGREALEIARQSEGPIVDPLELCAYAKVQVLPAKKNFWSLSRTKLSRLPTNSANILQRMWRSTGQQKAWSI